MRGKPLHNLLVRIAEQALRDGGFEVFAEHPMRLAGDRIDYVDLLAERGPIRLIVEAETTTRNALANASMAESVDLPLWIVVPNRAVMRSVNRALEKEVPMPGGRPVLIFLPGQLKQAVQELIFHFPDGE